MSTEHISVCICTYKREHLLGRLLDTLREQRHGGEFSFSVVVVDNDPSVSALHVVEIRRRDGMDVLYENETEKNIALARNRAIKSSRGEYVAFIDDDEFPGPFWLYDLYKTCRATGADGVLGPVLPMFDGDPPGWLIKGKLCERPSFPTGTLLKPHNCRTGNALLKRAIFLDSANFFDPSYGLTGGEDTDFFGRVKEKGFRFVWCQEASVHELVPPERWRKSFYLRRAYMRGRVNHLYSLKEPPTERIRVLARSSMAFVLYTLVLPFIVPMGDHVKMRFFDGYFHHIGRLSTALGISFLKTR